MLSGLFELRGVVDGSAEGGVGIAPTAVATLLAFIVGYASIAFLLRFLDDAHDRRSSSSTASCSAPSCSCSPPAGAIS